MSNPGAEPGDRFPVTRWSAIVAARSADDAERARGWDRITATYWKPVYKYIRIRWKRSPDDAADLTQEFFVRAISKGFLDGYDPAKSRLRTFLRVCLDRLIQNEDKARDRVKRGGGLSQVLLDFAGAERELGFASNAAAAEMAPVAVDSEMEAFFEQEWVRELFTAAVASLRTLCITRGKELHFQLFERYDLADDSGDEKLTYDFLAREFGLAVTDVTNHLAWTRREFRRLALAELAGMTASDEEYRAEARALFGVNLP